MKPTLPPRFATRLLEAALPPTERAQAMVGDLHEEFVERAAVSPRRARVWYVREAAGIALRYAGQARRYGRRRPSVGATTTTIWEGLVETLAFNVRYAVRRLARSPVFSLVAILSLALGIGGNTAMFSLVNAVIIRDMPFEDPEELVDVYEAGEGFSHGTLSYPDYVDLLEGSGDVFTDVAGAQFTLVQVDVEEGVELLPAEAVTGNYFDLLGVRPEAGRLLSSQDHVARGAHPVVVVSHAYWTSRFGADHEAVGTELRLAGRAYTVVGVAPEEYSGSVRGLEPAFFLPIMMFDEIEGSAGNTLEARGNQSFFAKARLQPGATLAQAEAVADRVGARLREEYPRYWRQDERFVLVPTADVIMNPMVDRVIVPAAGMLMVVVGFVLLIACANLASFLLARAADRRKEIAVRLAMGAKRRTLIGQLMTETVLLSALGGLAGIGLAALALDALVAADLPLPLPITLDLTLDRVVLSFSLAISVAAGLLFGLAPALQSTNPDVAPTLRDESAGGGRARGAALRSLLVVGQVSVSVVLLVGAGLFLRSLGASSRVEIGFGESPTGVLQVNVPADRYDEEEGRLFLQSLTESIALLPGVQAVGFIDNLHLNTLSTQNVRIKVDGVEPPPGNDFHLVDYGRIDDHFLTAAGVPLVAGRGFDETDVAGGEPTVIVSEEFVRRFLPSGDPIGSTITVNDRETRVVGVTRDHKVRQLGEAPRPYVYQSHRQDYTSWVTVLARTSADADRLALEMMAAARALEPEIMIVQNTTMDRHLAIMLLPRQLGALVVSGFALLALVLASIGLYGLVSYAVARRAREVGIRLSLGADSGSVVRMLTGGGMRLVAVGGVIGLVIAAALSRLLTSLLYGVPPLDPVTFFGVPLVLSAVALAAAWIPARRVTRIDPVSALRSE